MFAMIKRERKLEIKHEALNAVHFSEPFFAFEPLPFDEFFPLFVLVFLFPAIREFRISRIVTHTFSISFPN